MRAILAAGLLGVAATSALARDYGVAVEAPGWVRVALPEPWSAVEVRTSRGLKIASRYLGGPTGSFEPQLVRSQSGPRGWELSFDLGPAVVEHSALRIRTRERGTAAGCELRGGDDLTQFQLLARADLVWLGASAALQRDRIEYSPTTARFLQLIWPKSAGEPTFESIIVEPTTPERQRQLELALPIESQRDQVVVPEFYDGIDAITLLPAGGAQVEQVVFLAAPARFWSVCRRDSIAPFSVMRAECDGSVVRWLVEPPTPVERVSIRAPQRWVVFQASAPDSYRLTTPQRGSSAPALEVSWLGEPMVTLTATPIAAAAPEPIDEPLLAARRAQLHRPSQSWSIEIPAALVHQPVRLALNNDAIEAVRGDLHKLGLRQGTQALPFLRHTDTTPVVALTRQRRAALDFELPPSAGLMTQIELRSSDPGLPGHAWTLILEGATPERITIDRSRPDKNIAGSVTQFLELRLRAGHKRLRLEGLSEPEIDALQLTLWREQESLLFVAPPGEPPRLTDGFDPAPVPFPDLEPRRNLWSGGAPLVSTGTKAAEMAGGWEAWKRPILIGAQALVGVGLLILLWRATLRR